MTEPLTPEIVEAQPAKHPGGRPLKFASPQELEEAAQAYVDTCLKLVNKMDKEGNIITDCDGLPVTEIMVVRPLTMAGLANALKTCTKTLYTYEHKDEFLPIIKRYRQVCEQFTEESCYNRNAAGPIFLMKARYGVTETNAPIVHEHRISVNGPMNVGGLRQLMESEKAENQDNE